MVALMAPPPSCFPNRTALIELIPDSLSIHTVKHRSPPGSTFSDHFFAKFVKGSPGCIAAQRKFTESLAAYSIITYLLQVYTCERRNRKKRDDSDRGWDGNEFLT